MLRNGVAVTGDGALPDLLHATPTLRIDARATDEALFFAFAGSNTGGLFVEALDQSAPAPSSWEPSGYADDLFVAAFVRSCFAQRVAGGERPLVAMSHLVRVLTRPPGDVETIELRRGIVAELLETPSRREALARLDVSISARATPGRRRAWISKGCGLRPGPPCRARP